ncbi:MAG TPA: molybdenum cofactor biosynthesis protein MoaE [Pseudobdellovibrionaceae bacterium]|jgi:molybdopterin synthase catalytic subunit|nr:molybdenum cofactor biosynthesis protein MoaE [Pseudobdellovibrionaceae bacterium]
MGKVLVGVTNDVIDLSQVALWEPDSSHGAGNIFVGYVRNLNLGRSVTAVEYDCFESLARKVFSEIAEEAQQKFGSDTSVYILHRHGRLAVGEISVAIFVTTKHRDESYRASRYVIEEIKTRAPIWKKEFYVDGETEWVRGHALCQHRKVDHHEVGEKHHGSGSCGGHVHSHEAR